MVIKEQTFPQLEDGVQRNPNFLYYREIAQELTSGMFFTWLHCCIGIISTVQVYEFTFPSVSILERIRGANIARRDFSRMQNRN